MFGHRKTALTNKQWIPLVDGQVHTFDQTNGIARPQDLVPEEDRRGAQRAAEGAIISGMVGPGL